MFLFRLMSFVLGYVVLLVKGDMPEKFVNMAASRGIFLWDITRAGQKAVILKTRLSSIRPLRHIAKKTRCRFYIQQRSGFPFYISRLRRRKALVFGAVFFVGALYLLSSVVWFIEVNGNEQINTSEVLEAAAGSGLKRGTFKWLVEPEKVQAYIEDELELVAWAGVSLKGTKAIIEISERVLPGEEDLLPAHVIASKAGLVKEVLVFSGHPVVKEGATVIAGQMLISGEIPAPVEKPSGDDKLSETPQAAKPLRYVHARGIVRARVWYEGFGTAPMVEEGYKRTGSSIIRRSINLAGKEIIIPEKRTMTYEHYELETQVKRIPVWRNINIPVELITVKYCELSGYREERSRFEAVKIAGEEAEQIALSQLPEGTKVVERWSEEVARNLSSNTVAVKVVIETIEDIGLEKSFKP